MAEVPPYARPLGASGMAQVPDYARPLETRQEAADPLEGMSAADKFMAALGFGMKNMARSAGELASHIPGLGALASDPAAWEQEKRDAAPLLADPANRAELDTHLPLIGKVGVTPGSLGNLLGELVSTVPAGGLAGGGARLALAKLGVNAAATGLAGLMARAAPALAEGASQGTVLGGPDNRTLGAILGGGFAGAGSAAADTLGSFIRGIVKPTPEAAELMLKKVPLSIGQMNPGSALSKIEEAGQHSALGGTAIESTRQGARDVWQRLAAKDALAPGATLPSGQVRPGDFMTKLHADFEPAYSEIDATKIPAFIRGVSTSDIVKEAFKRVSQDDNVLGSEATRAAAHRFLQNQATILDKAPIFNAASEPVAAGAKALGPGSELATLGQVGAEDVPGGAFHTAEPLRVIRSNIRTKLRSIGDNGVEASAMRDILSQAEDLTTDALENRLGPEGAAKLQSIDAQYANLRALDNAVNSANDSEMGFTGAQLSRASQKGLGDIAKAQGAGGSMRELGQLGREVLDAKSPRTGAIKQTLPLGLNHAAGPLMAFLNGPGRNLALGATAPQKAAASLADLIQATLPSRAGAGALLPGFNSMLAPLEVQQR